MNKKTFYTEIAYLIGLVSIALGVALSERADLGMSMIVAPAYVLFRWINPVAPFFTFGMAEYCLQALLIVLMSTVMSKFRISYLFSFVTAVIYGFVLDGLVLLCKILPVFFLWQQIIWYVLGLIVTASGVALMFHTYIPPEAYDMIVKEIANHFHLNINKFKTIYDFSSLAVSVCMSFLIFGFGKFVGVGWGTLFCAAVNGWIIGRFSAFDEKHWVFKDRFRFRPYFTDQKLEQ